MRSNDNKINSDGIPWMSWHNVDKKKEYEQNYTIQTFYAVDMLELIKGKYLVY